MATESTSGTRVPAKTGDPASASHAAWPSASSSASINLADVRIEFSSADRELLDMVRRAATFCTPAPESCAPMRRLHARLMLSDRVGWEREGPGLARAFSPRDAESLEAVLRAALCDALSPDGALLHAAGAVVQDRALLFLALSGGGKSTVSRLVGDRFQLLSDETVCVRPAPDDSGYLAYGTCFWSTAGPKQYPSRGFPLAALCFLAKGPLACASLDRREALRLLMAQYHLRSSPEAGGESLEFGLRLLDQVPAYRLRFPIDARLDPLLESLAEAPVRTPPPTELDSVR
jgi:hypothetical protein